MDDLTPITETDMEKRVYDILRSQATTGVSDGASVSVEVATGA